MRYKRIVVLAARDLGTLERAGADVESGYCETVREAKKRARYLISDEYTQWTKEAPLGYSRVVVNGKVIYDYFAKA